ncbi:cyclic peptide export ABC transporter [Pedobacter steynii]|uniref:Cyclic peptide transporter n=1 Tax=Pedobacter steynii TaxID=430522 RepID=A0A1D7QJF0_9SPHI|nr:cyclic peptide export ABC transporter [Pedobacter steynii]AOM78760.1 hypothetical protein BFS30_17205 [Pedobacter steynii]
MRKNNLYVFLILIISSLGISPSLFAQLKDEAINSQIQNQVSELMEKGDIPGLSIVVLENGKSLIKSYGYADLELKKPVSPKTLFQIGSCSKAFTALAVEQLIRQEKINVNANVSQYIPWFHPDYKKKPVKITVNQLLHHTSGIAWSTISDIPESDSKDALEKTIRIIAGLPLNRLPGEKYEYATVNYDVLALIIEKVTGETFETYLQDSIINKLKLQYTSVGKPLDNELMSEGYKVGFFKARSYEAPVFKGNNSAGYVITNAIDMSEWLKFQMGMIPSDLYPLAKSTHSRDETVPLHGMDAYAAGWEIALNGTGEIFHGGLNPNFSAHILLRPDRKLAVAVIANSNSTYTPVIARKIMQLLASEKQENQPDPGDNNDTIYSVVFFGLLSYLLMTVLFICFMFSDLIKKERIYLGFSFAMVNQFLLAICFILPFLYGFYFLPRAFLGFDWRSIFIWSPISLSYLIVTAFIAITLTYLAYFLNRCFPNKNKHKDVIPGVVLFSLLSGIANVILIILVTSLVGSKIPLHYILSYYALILVVYLLGRRFVQMNLTKLTRGIVYDLKVKLLSKIFSTSYQHFEKIDRGKIYTALNDDVDVIGQSASTLVSLVTSIITTIGVFVYLASISLVVTLAVIVLFVAFSLAYYFVVQSTNIYFKDAREERNVYMRLINGIVDGFKELSLHGNKKILYRDEVTKSAKAYKEKRSVADIRFINAFLVGESLLLVLLALVAFCVPKFFPEIPVYTALNFVIILLYMIGPINTILGSVPQLLQFKIAWQKIQTFLAQIPANQDLHKKTGEVTSLVKSIKLEQVKFHYKNAENNDFSVGPINLEIKSGQIVFIIGGNGSGKTTLAKLITGLYSSDEGTVFINNMKTDSHCLGEYFSTVFSPFHLFEKLYNIDCTDKDEAIQKYLKLLDLEKKVTINDNKYSTINLSAGQRKRLALLQCYLEDSPIYLFDEWAADQDPSYRHFFYRTLLPEMRKQGKIVIAITHDDHYFDIADHVLKMDEGKLSTVDVVAPGETPDHFYGFKAPLLP